MTEKSPIRDDVFCADIVEVRASGLFTTRHRFLINDQEVGVLTLRSGRLRGTYQGAGLDEDYWIEQPRALKKEYLLGQGSSAIGAVKSLNRGKSGLLVRFRDLEYKASPQGPWGKTWLVKRTAGKIAFVIKPRGFFKSGGVILINTEIEILLLVFLYALINRKWQDENAY